MFGITGISSCCLLKRFNLKNYLTSNVPGLVAYKPVAYIKSVDTVTCLNFLCQKGGLTFPLLIFGKVPLPSEAAIGSVL